jgi:hypothetical protein
MGFNDIPRCVNDCIIKMAWVTKRWRSYNGVIFTFRIPQTSPMLGMKKDHVLLHTVTHMQQHCSMQEDASVSRFNILNMQLYSNSIFPLASSPRFTFFGNTDPRSGNDGSHPQGFVQNEEIYLHTILVVDYRFQEQGIRISFSDLNNLFQCTLSVKAAHLVVSPFSYP